MRLHLLVLAGLLLVSAATAVDPAARTVGTFNGSVTDVAASWTGERAAATATDPPPLVPPGSADRPTYRVYRDLLPTTIRFEGTTDPPECADGGFAPTADCFVDARFVALSDDGSRMVAVGYDSGQSGRGSWAVFHSEGSFTRVGSEADGAGTTLTGQVVGVDIVGTNVAIATTTAGLGAAGHVYVFTWSGATSPQLVKTVDLPGEPIRGVALTDGGAAAMVAVAGEDPLRFSVEPTITTVFRDEVDGLANAVAASRHASKWTIAGLDNGYVIYYRSGSTPTGNDAHNSHTQLFDLGTQAVTAVAIRADATAFAVGDDGAASGQGAVRVYGLDPATGDFTAFPLLPTMPAAISDLSFSADGKYLVAAAGNVVRLYHVTATGASQVWSHTQAGATGRVAIDDDGDHAYSAFGAAVVAFDGVHDIDVSRSGSDAPAQPGLPRVSVLAFRNDGNRYEDILAAVTAPAGWDSNLSAAAFQLGPDQRLNVELSLTPPAQTPPGTYAATVAYTTASGAEGELAVSVTVPAVRRWTLAVDGAASVGIETGGPAEFRLVVTNAGNVAGSTGVQVSGLPIGWTSALQPATVDAQPGAATPVVVRVEAPTDAAQLAQAIVNVRLTQDAGQQATLTATVGARFSVAVDSAGSVGLAPGATAQLALTARNTGNAPDSIRLDIGALPTGWSAAFATGQTTQIVAGVAPGQAVPVTVSIRAPAGAEVNRQIQFTITATSLGDDTQRSIETVIARVQATTTTTTDNGTPFLALPLALAALAGLAVARRRAQP